MCDAKELGVLADSLLSQRMDAILRSSLYSHFSESLSGLATIRIFGVAKSFSEENAERINLENRSGQVQ